MLLDTIHKQFATIEKCIYDNKPKLLYHYTCADGLLGIVNNNELWATDSMFVNDAVEMKYGMDLMERLHSKKMISSDLSEDEKCFISLLTEDITQTKVSSYILCFCEDGDLMSQWRGYGQLGAGYSIGFRVAGFRDENAYGSPKLMRVIYNPKLQERLLSDIVDVGAKLFMHHKKKQLNLQKCHEADINCCHETDINWTILDLKYSLLCTNDICDAIYGITLDLLTACTYSFKHPAFIEEKEWRMVLNVDSDRKRSLAKNNLLNIRNRANNLVPYIKLKANSICGPKTSKLPIHRVYCGPTTDKNAATIALKMLLNMSSYKSVNVLFSKSPYRQT